MVPENHGNITVRSFISLNQRAIKMHHSLAVIANTQRGLSHILKLENHQNVIKMHLTYQEPIKMPVILGCNNCAGIEKARFYFPTLFPKGGFEII